jgi:hypothetical protein
MPQRGAGTSLSITASQWHWRIFEDFEWLKQLQNEA